MRRAVVLFLGLVACSASDGDNDTEDGSTSTSTTAPTTGMPPTTGGTEDTSTSIGTSTSGSTGTSTTDATTTGQETTTDSGSSTGASSTGSTGGTGSTGSTGSTGAAGPAFDTAHMVFADKCATCHTEASSGGHNIGAADINAAYADSQLNAEIAFCAGLTKGACTLVRVQSGQMPLGAGCTGDPSEDAGNFACLTQAEQDTLQAWIDGGQEGPM